MGWGRRSRADGWDRWKRTSKAWLSRLDWVTPVPETWAPARKKRQRRWEREPRCGQQHPTTGNRPAQYHAVGVPRSSSVSRSQGSPVLRRCPLLPGPHGGEGGSGSKLAAHPLSHLFLAVFHALQIHLSFPTSQIRSLLIHSVTWGKSLLYP